MSFRTVKQQDLQQTINLHSVPELEMLIFNSESLTDKSYRNQQVATLKETQEETMENEFSILTLVIKYDISHLVSNGWPLEHFSHT